MINPYRNDFDALPMFQPANRISTAASRPRFRHAAHPGSGELRLLPGGISGLYSDGSRGGNGGRNTMQYRNQLPVGSFQIETSLPGLQEFNPPLGSGTSGNCGTEDGRSGCRLASAFHSMRPHRRCSHGARAMTFKYIWNVPTTKQADACRERCFP